MNRRHRCRNPPLPEGSDSTTNRISPLVLSETPSPSSNRTLLTVLVLGSLSNSGHWFAIKHLTHRSLAGGIMLRQPAMSATADNPKRFPPLSPGTYLWREQADHEPDALHQPRHADKQADTVGCPVRGTPMHQKPDEKRSL